MTTVHRIVDADGREECYLFSGRAHGQPVLYVASVLYMKRTAETSVASVRSFHSTRSASDARRQAEGWIKGNLFPRYTIKRLREV